MIWQENVIVESLDCAVFILLDGGVVADFDCIDGLAEIISTIFCA